MIIARFENPVSDASKKSGEMVMDMFQRRLSDFRKAMAEAGLDIAVITDDDNVYYLSGYYDYLHMEFGRPTILVVQREGDSLLITPSLDAVMAHHSARVDRIAAWNDGAGEEWRAELPVALAGSGSVGNTLN